MYWFTRKKQNRIMIICGMVAFIVAEVLGETVGKLYSNHQPFAELTNVNQLIGHTIDNSFPSDHAIQFFSICITFFLFKKNLRFMWLLLAFLVGISRRDFTYLGRGSLSRRYLYGSDFRNIICHNLLFGDSWYKFNS